MALKDRSQGTEFASIEKQLLFSDDIGFVRYDKRKGCLFLDPSPFLPTTKNELYVCLNPNVPLEGKLIEISVVEKEDIFVGDSINKVTKTTIKYFASWKEHSPTKFTKRDNLISNQEFVDYFARQYLSLFGTCEDVAECTALCALSSPQFSMGLGGINASVHGKKARWVNFNQSLSFIPREFRSAVSKYQYNITSKERKPVVGNSIEISCMFHEPQETSVHIAVPFDFEIRGKNYAWRKEEAPLMRAFLIDSLFNEPAIPDNLEKKVMDGIYALQWEYLTSNKIPYIQDLSSAVPRLCKSFARLNRSESVNIYDVAEISDLWVHMHRQALKIADKRGILLKFKDVSLPAKELFAKLVDLYNYDTVFDIEEAKKEIKLPRGSFDNYFEELRLNGYIYCPIYKKARLIDVVIPSF